MDFSPLDELKNQTIKPFLTIYYCKFEIEQLLEFKMPTFIEQKNIISNRRYFILIYKQAKT